MVTVITKTIGPTGRDYATFQLAEAATSSIGTSADLVANDEAIVFEADDTTFTVGSTFFIANTSLTADATRNVSYTAASGRPVYTYTGTGTAVQFYDAYTRWSGIDVVGGSAGKVMNVRANAGYGAAQAGTLIENATITAGTTAVACEKLATGQALGTSSEPITLRNLVTKSRVAVSQFISGTGHTTGAHCLVVNCTHLGGSTANNVWNWALVGGMPDASFKIINCANLAQDSSSDANITGGGVDVSGSTNNIGNAAGLPSQFRFENVAGGIGAQYTPTTSFSTPLGAGDYSVFMGATGALANKTGNDVWQQGVGPSANASVPTTDINGVARSGASCNPGAFEADGFVAPTITTQTIGPVGRDYASFTLADATMSSRDLTLTNEAFVFEADAATYTTTFSPSSTVVADATRNVTYRPAAGSEHGGIAGAGVHIDTGSSGRPFTVYGEFVVIEGLSLATTTTYCTWIQGAGTIIRNCIGRGANRSFFVYAGTALNPIVLENCVGSEGTSYAFLILGGGPHGGIANARVVNCTGSSTGNDAFRTQATVSGTSATAEYINCVGLSTYTHQTVGSFATATGSNNVGGSLNRWPVGTRLNGLFYTLSTAYDPGAGDFALYVGKNGALLDSPNNDVINGGVGPASNSDVPTTDILGDTRSGTTTNPGAFALAQATAVLTRTIGPVGRDYATFTAAEADVTNIGGSADLVFENERIEFEADAGTYSEGVTFNSNLTTDPTRNVTYRPAAGSEHGGVPGAGVRIQFGNLSLSSTCTSVDDPFNVLDGLELDWTDTSGTGRSCDINWKAKGAACKNLILRHAGTGALLACTSTRTTVSTDFPVTFENSVLRGSGHGFRVWNYGASDKAFTVTNCTIECVGRAFDIFSNTDDTTYTITNNLILAASEDWRDQGGGGTSTVLGSNNFGPQTSATHVFPAALKGSPYPITATTNTTPGFGDYAIYEAGTGALVVVDDNAALGGGVGPAANADVPVYDINGVKRIGGGCDPGAFEGDRARSTDVWDVMYGPHNIPGTFGNLVQSLPTTIADTVPSAAEIAAAVWAALTSANNTSGSFGRMTQQTHLSATKAGSLYQEEQD